MALVSINPSRPKERGGSSLEKIALGLDIASKTLGLALGVPEFLQKKKAGELNQTESKVNIYQNTTIPQPGDKNIIDVEGQPRAVVPGKKNIIEDLQVKNLQGDMAEEERKRHPLGEEAKKSYIMMLKQSGITNITADMVPATVGGFEDAIKSRLSAIQIIPQQSKEFDYKKSEDVKKEERETQSKYIKFLDQYASTSEDAKEIKTALANKSVIERGVDQMIELRKKHPNGTITDREDIARGQQLSVQALLKYKNLAQLGVLSKTDIELIDRLFPQNPLEVNPSAIVGQDPTMAKLKQLKQNLHTDFNMFLETKGLNGLSDPVDPTANPNYKGETINQGGHTYQWNGKTYE